MGELLRAKILERLKALPPGVATVKSIQQAAQRKQRKRDSKEILLITPKALEIVVIEVINKLNLKRSRKPTVLDERMFLAHVEPIRRACWRNIKCCVRAMRRWSDGPSTCSRRSSSGIAPWKAARLRLEKLSYGVASVPEGDEGPRLAAIRWVPRRSRHRREKRPRSRSMSSPTRM
jgi:hypothetical protein